jgi:phage-related minor tail protein
VYFFKSIKTIIMKKTLFLIASLVIFFASCKDDDENPITTQAMTATVDGADWSATTQIIAYMSGDQLVIQALQNSNDQIGLFVNASTPGTYTFDATGTSHRGTYMKQVQGINTVFASSAGTVTISEFSATVVKGTFSFTADRTSLGTTTTVEVTNGNFVVLLQ